MKQLSQQLKNQPLAEHARRASFATVGICLFLISFMTITRLLFTEEVVATNNLRAMAKIYYEDYYYEKFTADQSGTALAAVFKPYIETGFRAVTLRQLLTFDNSRLSAEAAKFANCDKIASHIKITPLPPYGAGDYHLETALVCNEE